MFDIPRLSFSSGRGSPQWILTAPVGKIANTVHIADGRGRVFSQTTEYALRASAALATTDAPSQQIADAAKVPSGYLSKVLQSLVRAKTLADMIDPRDRP